MLVLKNSQAQNESVHVSVVRDVQVNAPARICSWKFLKENKFAPLVPDFIFKGNNE